MIQKFKVTTDQLLEDLYNAALINPEIETLSDLIRHKTPHSGSTYYFRFGLIKNVAAALYNKYGIYIKTNPVTYPHWTNSDTAKQIIVSEFLRIQKLLQKPPSRNELIQYSVYAGIQFGIERNFTNYTNLCIHIGQCRRQRPNVSKKIRKIKQKDYILNLQEINRAYHGVPSILAAFRLCHTHASTIRSIFGSVDNWFKKANVPLPLTVGIYRDKTDKEIFDKLRQIYQRTGKIPPAKTVYDKMPDRSICSRQLGRRFGSYRKAWELALAS